MNDLMWHRVRLTAIKAESVFGHYESLLLPLVALLLPASMSLRLFLSCLATSDETLSTPPPGAPVASGSSRLSVDGGESLLEQISKSGH